MSWSDLSLRPTDPELEALRKKEAEEALENLGPNGLRKLKRSDPAKAGLVVQVARVWEMLSLIRPKKPRGPNKPST